MAAQRVRKSFAEVIFDHSTNLLKGTWMKEEIESDMSFFIIYKIQNMDNRWAYYIIFVSSARHCNDFNNISFMQLQVDAIQSYGLRLIHSLQEIFVSKYKYSLLKCIIYYELQRWNSGDNNKYYATHDAWHKISIGRTNKLCVHDVG